MLRVAGVTLAAAGVAACAGSGGRRVVVLGAGLAGLAAGVRLANAGYQVTVLEARDRPGGRVLTVREPFTGGGYAEAGAVRIPDVHVHTRKFIAEFGLADQLFDYGQDTGSRLWYVGGRRFVTPQPGQAWPIDGLAEAERADPAARMANYLGPALTGAGNTLAPDWPAGAAGDLDGLTLAALVRRHGGSDAWLRWFRADEGDLTEANALAVGGTEAGVAAMRVTYGLRGGNDRLPRAMAAALGDRVRYRCPVRRVMASPEGVTVSYTDPGGAAQELTADHGVCAVPFPVLHRLELSGLSDAKRRAVAEYRLAPLARVYFQTRDRFWQADPLGRLGGLKLAGTDTAAERVWNTSAGQPGPEGMLQAYLFGANADALARVPAAERAGVIQAEVAKFLPELPGRVLASYVKVWSEDEFAGGAWASARPGQLRWILPAARAPEGRLHFAGEHTSVSVAWMDGALESGERAAREIIGGQT